MGHVRLRLYRISPHADLSGRGGLLGPARWHKAPRAIVYLSEHPALSALEVLVHVDDRADLPEWFQLLVVEVPDGPSASPPKTLDPGHLGAAQAWGDAWLAAGGTPLARVPSVIVPEAFNWLLNPLHAAAATAHVAAVLRHPWDERLRGGA